MLSDFAIVKKRKPIEKRSLAWFAMGPCLLLLTLAVVLLHAIQIPVWLLAACAIGVIISSFFQIFGAIFTSILVVYLQIPTLNDLTSILFTTSLLLSFFIIALSAQEVKKLMPAVQEKRAEASVSVLEVPQVVEEIDVRPQDAEVAALTAKEEHNIQVLYQQLRKQFEEKSQILNLTRRQLFETENALLAKEREILEKERTDSAELKEFQKLLLDLQGHQELLEAQLLETEDLVSKLMESSGSNKL